MCDIFLRPWWGCPPAKQHSWWLRFAKFALHHNCWVGPVNRIPGLVQHRVTVFGHEILICPWNPLGNHGDEAASWGHLGPVPLMTGRHPLGSIFQQHGLAIAIKVTTLTGNVALVNGAASDWIILKKHKPWKHTYIYKLEPFTHIYVPLLYNSH